MGPPALISDRLVLTPLVVADAAEMVSVLSDPRLYDFTGDDPPSLRELEDRYRAQVAGPSDGGEVWHNWIVRLVDSQLAIGFVQATVMGEEADVAWVIGVNHQGQGMAQEAAAAMCRWLGSQGARRITAHIHPQHRASGRVAASVGMGPTDEVDEDGELVWEGLVSHPPDTF